MEIKLEDYEQKLIEANKSVSSNRLEALEMLYHLVELIINNKDAFNEMYPKRKFDLINLQSRIKMVKSRLDKKQQAECADLDEERAELDERLKEEVSVLKIGDKIDEIYVDIDDMRKEAFAFLEEGKIKSSKSGYLKIYKKLDGIQKKYKL